MVAERPATCQCCWLRNVPQHASVADWLLNVPQHASVSQGRICSDNCSCCHTEIEAADHPSYLTQSHHTDTGPSIPSTDPIPPGAGQGHHWSANFEVTGVTRPGKTSTVEVGIELRSAALEADGVPLANEAADYCGGQHNRGGGVPSRRIFLFCKQTLCGGPLNRSCHTQPPPLLSGVFDAAVINCAWY